MSTPTPDLTQSSPSPLRIGLVGSRFTVVLYLLVVCFQFLVNFTVNGIVYLSVPDVTGQVDQAATNSAFVTGVFLFVCGVVSATVNMRASALSGGSRPVLTAASYVHSIVIIGLGSLIWWLLIAIHPLLFVMGRESFPLGVDSWIFVLFAWVACDGAGRFIGGLARCIGSTWNESLCSWVRFRWASAPSVRRSRGWSSPSSTSPATCPRCTPPSTCSVSSR